jgi:hypothetical protein
MENPAINPVPPTPSKAPHVLALVRWRGRNPKANLRSLAILWRFGGLLSADLAFESEA